MRGRTSFSLVATIATLAFIVIAELFLNVRLTGIPKYLSGSSLKVAGGQTVAATNHHSIAAANATTVDDWRRDKLPPVVQAPRVITVSGIDELHRFSYWGKNAFCKDVLLVPNNNNNNNATNEARSSLPVLTVHFTFGCQDLFEKSGLGTGNWISSFYAMRMAALVHGNVNIRMTCDDAELEKKSLVIPWFMGNFSAGGRSNALLLLPADRPSLEQACGDYDNSPIGFMIPYARHELRRMAIALVGVPSPHHPAAAFAKQYMVQSSSSYMDGTEMQVAAQQADAPLFPNTELDDAVAHFRCGDLIQSNHPSFGFVKFSAFSKRLFNTTKSIGIVTQPFDTNSQSRKEDSGPTKQRLCRDIVYLFRDHLREKFPNARIRIHNGHNETIALTFARMIMAKQVISPISSFSVFPALATFGNGYIRKPDFPRAPNKWLKTPPVDKLYDNLELMDEPNVLMTRQVKALRRLPGGNDNVHEWFRNDTYCGTSECL